MPRRVQPEAFRNDLIALRSPLIELHRALLEAERRQYESAHGRVSAAELLRLALNDEQFAWLHQIAAIIVRVDELLASDALDASAVAVLSVYVRSLLRPAPDGSAFERRYDHAVQGDPSVLLAHGRVIQALPTDSGTLPETVH